MRITTACMLALIMACTALGCLSTPETHYYTLDMAACGRIRPEVNIRIDRMRVSESLARREVLIKKSPTEIEYYATDQWAANISELVQEKLVEEFGLAQEGRKSIVLSGVVLAFEQEDTAEGAMGHVKLLFEFYHDHRDGEALLEKTYDKRLKAAGNDAGSVVKAISEALELIAAEIAADAAALS